MAGAAASSSPLLERLIATADARHVAIRASRPRDSARSYQPNSWLRMPLMLRHRGLTMILVPLLSVAVVALGFTPYAVYRADEWACERLEKGRLAFSVVLSALSFLLVFRLNRASVRHYEARQLCGWMMIHWRARAPTRTSPPDATSCAPVHTLCARAHPVHPCTP